MSAVIRLFSGRIVNNTTQLTAGAYKLEVITRFSHGRELKEPRTIALEAVLTVA
jgi:hypothetical protein